MEPGADLAAVTAVQVREVVERLIAAARWQRGQPDVLVVLDAGYDAHRIAHLLTDMPIEVLGRLRSDRVMRKPVPVPPLASPERCHPLFDHAAVCDAQAEPDQLVAADRAPARYHLAVTGPARQTLAADAVLSVTTRSSAASSVRDTTDPAQRITVARGRLRPAPGRGAGGSALIIPPWPSTLCPPPAQAAEPSCPTPRPAWP
nr:transposase [Streptomyces sp. C]